MARILVLRFNEAYLRLVEQKDRHCKNREHFFAVAAQLMRNILVDYARRQHAAKRGGQMRAVTLDEAALVSQKRAEEVRAVRSTSRLLREESLFEAISFEAVI